MDGFLVELTWCSRAQQTHTILMNRIRLRANLAIFFAEMFNALNVNAQKYLLPDYFSPFEMLIIRCVFAAALFWVVSLFTRKQTVAGKDILFMLTIGALSLTSYITFYLWGVSESSPVDSSLIMTTMPLFVFGLSLVIFKEKVSWFKSLGLLLGVAGIVLLVLSTELGVSHRNTLAGNLFCFLSALSYAIYMIVNKKLTEKYSAVTMLKWMFLGATGFSVVIGLFSGLRSPGILSAQTPLPTLLLIFVLVFPTGLTYLLIPYALKNLPASSVAIYDYEVPVVASIVAVIFRQAGFQWDQLLAAALIFAAVFIVVSENKRLCRCDDDGPDFEM